jgi:uncharacterized membrane protein
MDALNILMRVLHILSAMVLAGGAVAWLCAAIPANDPLSDETRRKVGDAMARAWRPFVLLGTIGILVSGTYNFVAKSRRMVLPASYHAFFGIKVLLALHVIAALLLATRPGNEKRSRQLIGVVFSAMLIVVCSAVLRWLTQ